MSISITNIMRSVTKTEKLNILTFPSDPVFDHLWTLCKENIYLYTGNNEYSDLPNVNILDKEGIGLNTDGFDCMVVYETELNEGMIKNAENLHIPLIRVSFSGLRGQCSYSLNLGEKSQGLGSMVKVPTPTKIERHPKNTWLCRQDTAHILSGNIEHLEYNPYNRYEQYKSCLGLINLHGNFYIPELEECAILGIPCYTIKNDFHKNIPTFSTLSELYGLIKVYNTIDMTDYIGRPDLFSEIGDIIRTTKGHV